MLSMTAQRALRAYGGADVWTSANGVQADITLNGLLFVLKRRVIPPHAHITTALRTPRATISPVDRRGTTGILDGFSVRLVAPDGQVIAQREDARTSTGSHHIWNAWDTLDVMY